VTSTPADLLRSLGSGVRPAGTDRPASAPLHGPSFDELLRAVQEGQFRTGAPVRIADGAGVTLSESQLARLSVAADQAEAKGASRAAVIIDGMILTMDVTVRTVTGVLRPEQSQVQAGLDSVITVAPVPSDDATPGGTARWSVLGSGASMLRMLESSEELTH
jgi:hypothetical protein